MLQRWDRSTPKEFRTFWDMQPLLQNAARSLSGRHGSYMIKNFRQRAAEENNTSWARPDPGVYAQSYALSTEGWCRYCHSVDHISDTCPSHPRSAYPCKRGLGVLQPLASKCPPIPNADDTICKKFTTVTATLVWPAGSVTYAVIARMLTIQ